MASFMHRCHYHQQWYAWWWWWLWWWMWVTGNISRFHPFNTLHTIIILLASFWASLFYFKDPHSVEKCIWKVSPWMTLSRRSDASQMFWQCCYEMTWQAVGVLVGDDPFCPASLRHFSGHSLSHLFIQSHKFHSYWVSESCSHKSMSILLKYLD